MKCVACLEQIFVGHVGDIEDHLCQKHKDELHKEESEIIKNYLHEVHSGN